MRSLLALIFVVAGACVASAEPYWRVTRLEWQFEDEVNYTNFVSAIGRSKCQSFDECIHSRANPYFGSDPRDTRFSTDCADLPYMLRSYFAWKNGLPMSVAYPMVSADGTPGDNRYTTNGNRPKGRIDIIAYSPERVPYGISGMKWIADSISSASYRVDPSMREAMTTVSGRHYSRIGSDFYSVKVQRGSIRPGTVIYDPQGHVAVVYSVENDGRILFMDAHPDNSITRGVYGKKFIRSRPSQGAGFKNFRPQRLFGSQFDERLGMYVGGEIWSRAMNEIEDYDLAQYYGTKRGETWSKGLFVLGGKPMDYYDWVRHRLAKGKLKIDPVEEVRHAAEAICGDIKDRVNSVSAAIEAGVDDREHPDRLPDNIFAASGDWEAYATASRDARLRSSFAELYEDVRRLTDRAEGGAELAYKGKNLKSDVLKAYDDASKACVVQYKNSNGRRVSLDLESVRKRLFALSFDPYNCVERRWGATAPDELRSCRENREKQNWYTAEQRLRNQLERNGDAKMGFSLRELQDKADKSGTDKVPLTDVRALLQSK